MLCFPDFVFKVAQSIKEQTGQVQLNKGEIDQIKPRNSETRLIKALYVGVDEYVTVLDDGLPGLEVPTESNQSQSKLLSCQLRVTVTSCFVYNVIRGL